MVKNKMLEILVGVARMPVEYRRLRQKELIHDYEPHLDSYALEAFNQLIERPGTSQISPKAEEWVDAVKRLAGHERIPVSH